MLRRWRVGSAALGASAVLVCAVGAAQASTPPADRTPSAAQNSDKPAPASHRAPYVVALGDSYMAGIGAGDYWERDGCRRSANSYAALWSARTRGAFTDLSCPGSTVDDVARQLPLVPQGADVVLVEVGGNDIGFGSIAGACFVGGTSSCVAAADRARAQASQLPSRLTPLLAAVQREAPGARVTAFGYPGLVGLPSQCAASAAGSVISTESVVALRRVQRALDAAVRRAAAAAGVGYLDWPAAVNGHSLCSADPWYVLPGTGRLDDLLHPTVEATETMAAHLAARISR